MLLLDTPHTLAGAHGEPDEVYAFVGITDFAVKPFRKTTVIVAEYGSVIDGAWVVGRAIANRIVLRDIAEVIGGAINPETNKVEQGVVRAAVTAFTDLRAALAKPVDADPDADYYDALSSELYAWLIAKGYYEGTIV